MWLSNELQIDEDTIIVEQRTYTVTPLFADATLTTSSNVQLPLPTIQEDIQEEEDNLSTL